MKHKSIWILSVTKQLHLVTLEKQHFIMYELSDSTDKYSIEFLGKKPDLWYEAFCTDASFYFGDNKNEALLKFSIMHPNEKLYEDVGKFEAVVLEMNSKIGRFDRLNSPALSDEQMGEKYKEVVL